MVTTPENENWRHESYPATRISEGGMIFRLSQELNAEIKAGALRALPLHENVFADWPAHLFVAGRTQYLLLSNTKALYPTVMHAKGITNDSHFIERALGGIREFMEADGQAFAYRRFLDDRFTSSPPVMAFSDGRGVADEEAVHTDSGCNRTRPGPAAAAGVSG